MINRDTTGRFVKGHAKVGDYKTPKGVHHSSETEIKSGQRLSPKTEFKKGEKPWNAGTKGLVKAWNKGKKMTTPNWNSGTATILQCTVCSENYRPTSRIKTSKYCSKICHGLDKRGENNPRWNGGSGTLRHQEMGRVEYKSWRNAVFARDNYTCQICNAYGVYIQADHIKGWAQYPELRYEVSNGRTLCVPCHYYVTFKRKMPTGYKWGSTKKGGAF